METMPDYSESYKLLHAGILALARAERQGLRVDMKYVVKKKQQLSNKIEYLEDEFKSTEFYRKWKKSSSTPVNIHSGHQLGIYLYDVLKLKVSKTSKAGKGSTDEEALKQLAIPELDNLLRISKLKKIRDTYLEGFAREQVNGIIHPFFNLHLVTTYRSSSDSPNFQNIPKRDKEAMNICRKAIFPRIGHQLVEYDFSGAEVRVAACYHKDPTMLKYLRDSTTDMHGDLAAQLFIIDDFDKNIKEYGILRQAAKNGFVFPQFYGSYWKNCAFNLVCDWGKLPISGKWKKGQGIAMPEGSFLSDHLISKGITEFGTITNAQYGQKATGYLAHVKKIEEDFWQKRFPEYAKWKDKVWAEYQKCGYIEFYTGFRTSGLLKKTDVTNYQVQGSAFHCLLWSLIQVDKFIYDNNLDSRIVGQIHDSIIIDMDPKELNLLSEKVEQIITKDLPNEWKWINVPIKVERDVYEVDGSWADAIKT